MRSLNEAFNTAVADNKFRGTYRGVFPIKVNQLREVVEEILEAGRPYHYGIEVGSKPEIFAGLSVHTDNESLIVCNGYKDDNYIRTAMIGRKLGKKVILIAEKVSEVRAITRIAKEMGVEPMIGLRVRLVTKGAGKWAESGGEHAKFGLSTAEILLAAQIMKEAGMSSAFKLIHFHIGSQVPDILIIKRAVREATRYYAKLRKMGHPIEYLDVGGGLAIDYDGSRSTFHSSMNYSVEEYARDVVYNITDICDDEKVPHPNIVSESGRAIVAHHSVLVVEGLRRHRKDGDVPGRARRPRSQAHQRADVRRREPLRAQPRGVLARHRAGQRRGAKDVRARPLAARRQGQDRDPLLANRDADAEDRQRPRPERGPGGHRRAPQSALGSAHLQLLGLPVAPRPLGPGLALPDRAHPPPRRAPAVAEHAGGHHL